MVGVSEKRFETEIETALAAQGYEKGRPEDYHQALLLLPKTVLRFVQATQPKEWAKLQEQYKAEAEERFLARLSAEIERRGTLDVLRNGVRDVGARVSLAFFRPPTKLNPETQKLYQANVFTVVRQLEYVGQGGRLRYPDVTIFLNGLPVFTAELIDTNFKFYKLVTDNKAFSEAFMGWLFERYKNTNAATSKRL